MSVLYCAIPHFAAALARRENPALGEQPIVLIGPDGRVVDASAEAADCGIVAGMTARLAEIRCPQACLLDAEVARCRQELETLYQVLEQAGPKVEPHGWGAAYVDLGDRSPAGEGTVAQCGEIGKAVRRELGQALQPALGWDNHKFTAQSAARYARPGHLRAIAAVQEQDFLRPLPVALLPLAADVVQRLHFLGLCTLGQYAALPPAAVGQQFGPEGKLAQRLARGLDDRPVVPRWQTPHQVAEIEFEAPLAEREGLVAALRSLVSPLLARVRQSLQACGRVRLTLQFDAGSAQEKERAFLLPTAGEERVVQALAGLLDGMCGGSGTGNVPPQGEGRTGITALAVALEQIQDAVPEQLTLFPLRDEREGKLQEVQRYMATRFGANHLRRAMLALPGAPLPEWRIGWLEGG